MWLGTGFSPPHPATTFVLFEDRFARVFGSHGFLSHRPKVLTHGITIENFHPGLPSPP
jgi:hypothetical protein